MPGESSARPYRIRLRDQSIEPAPPVSENTWDQIFLAVREQRLTGLRAAGQMTNALLRRVARLGHLTALHLEGSAHVTDEGLAHLAGMPQLESLNLTGCDITDRGLAVLRELPSLREFALYHHRKVSDLGLSHLAACPHLERVDLLGCRAGDGVIRALTGKPKLRHFISGEQVTDAGLALLHEFPFYKTWQGGAPEYSLMTFDPKPNHLLLRGPITDEGLRSLAGLHGLFSLNLDDSRLHITNAGLQPLAELSHLNCLGFAATDETMASIATLPHLRHLICQDTTAGDEGFTALSASRSLEYIWGRRCYNLTGRGFLALSRMPALRGLAVSCRNVDDEALAKLPDFPALTEFMPIDVPDAGFRHVGRCERLEALWCMYCRDTGDIATEHIAGLRRLKTYYAGRTEITDRSLEILSAITSLERITFHACAGITDAGLAKLTVLPRLRELMVDGN